MKSLQAIASDVAQRLKSALVTSTVLTPECRAVIEQFRDAGAISRDRAQAYHPHGWLDESAFRRLAQLGVIREPARGRYYLDEHALRRLET